jgi:hypothetical protein
MLSKRALVSVFFLAVLALLAYQAAKAAVDLVYFTATPQENGILLEWETATEIDNIGFYVTRSTNPGGTYDTVSPFISAEGEGVIGAQYDFLDDDVENGILYFYLLEALDTNQGVETHGPITATFSGQIGNTDTPTPTITDTPTPSKTSKTTTPTITRSPTETRTPIPTRTNTPIPPTPTATVYTETPAPSETFTITPSPTLLDAPAIILQVPTDTITPLPTLGSISPQPSPTDTTNGLFNRFSESNNILIFGAICLFVLVWAAIAVAVFIYLQKRNA